MSQYTDKINQIAKDFAYMEEMEGTSCISAYGGQFRIMYNHGGEKIEINRDGVEIDGKKVGKMESGEIFGELSLILDENRKASVKAISPSEIIEINKTALEAILLSSNIELHKMIQQMSKELGKTSGFKLPISKKDLTELVKDSPDVIRALSLQLHYRLSQRIFQ